MTILEKILKANDIYTNGLHPAHAWVGFDFDKTLVQTDGLGETKMNPGEPIQPIADLAKEVLKHGVQVKIFTARVHYSPESLPVVEKWCEKYIGKKLEITNVKTAGMFYLLDDKAFNVKINGDILHE